MLIQKLDQILDYCGFLFTKTQGKCIYSNNEHVVAEPVHVVAMPVYVVPVPIRVVPELARVTEHVRGGEQVETK